MIRRGESVTRYTILSECAKRKAEIALIAQGREVMRNPKITHCPTSGKSAKGADKHLGTELHTLGFELVTSRLVQRTGADY